MIQGIHKYNQEEHRFMNQLSDPIAVFDSGMGGISVLREMTKLMPNEDFIYYGDSLNAPYGVKPLEEVRQLTYACAEHLLERGVKEIIIACNTATSAACKIMRGMYPDLPLVGIEPAVKPAAQNHRGEKVAVMATPLTLHEEKFKQLVKRYENLATIIPVPCPDLVEYVEKGILEGPELEGYLKDVLTPCLQEGIKAVVLGCTHFPLVKSAIGKVVGESVRIYDGGEGTARQAKCLLAAKNLCTDQEKGHICFESSAPEKEAYYEALYRKAAHIDSRVKL